MKRFLFFLGLLVQSSLVPAAPPANVYLDNGELNYVGQISPAANQSLFALFEKLEKKPAILSIRSMGGSTTPGMALGRWVHSHGITVKVMEYCFSSCANYVFPAAPRKIVSNFAVVGYHGGLSSLHFAGDEQDEARIAAMPPDEQGAARKRLQQELKQSIALQEAEERKFFSSLGVDQRMTTMGQQPGYIKTMDEAGNLLGWTFSVDGFEKLGVSNIRVVNPPWKPGFVNSGASVLVIEPDKHL